MNEPKGTTSQTATGTKALIFVVDDEPMLLELASVILQPLGYRVATFRDPGLAINAYKEANPAPALIVTDYAMHNLNGMELVEACREMNPRQRILLVSGTVDENVYADSPIRPDRFLAKPYQARQLVEAVQSLVPA
jgi:CheY-like chemotaxis protein